MVRVQATSGEWISWQPPAAVDLQLRSLGRFAEQVRLIEAHRAERREAGAVFGPASLFGRLWQAAGLRPYSLISSATNASSSR